MPPAPIRRTSLSVVTILVTVAVAACSGGSSASQAPAASAPAATSGAGATKAPASQGTGSTGSDLAAITSSATIKEILGETPTPKCDASVAFKSKSCIWTAADGSWVKVEDSISIETPTLETFKERMTKTLGLDKPVEGLGQAAQVGTTKRGARIAVFLGEGHVIWAVINKPGDAAKQTAQVTAMAKALIAGL